jgi:hypothetical protein
MPSVHSTFLDTSRSATAGHLPRGALELRRAERRRQCLGRYQPADAELIPTFADRVKIIPCPEVTCGH